MASINTASRKLNFRTLPVLSSKGTKTNSDPHHGAVSDQSLRVQVFLLCSRTNVAPIIRRSGWSSISTTFLFRIFSELNDGCTIKSIFAMKKRYG